MPAGARAIAGKSAVVVAAVTAGIALIGCGPADRPLRLRAADGHEYQILRMRSMSSSSAPARPVVEYRATTSLADHTAMGREAEDLMTALESAISANPNQVTLEEEAIVVAVAIPVNAWKDPETLAFRVRRSSTGWQSLGTLDVSP